MQLIAKISEGIIFQSSESARVQFERIQGLNNELLNTRRNLEKANARLNLLNAELNNRLVKDALTGLISRYQFREEMEWAISSKQGKGIFAFLDIDNFKAVNDTYGHQAGDDYLVEFARRMDNLALDNCLKIRIAGDEFGLFYYGLEKAEEDEIDFLWNKVQAGILSKPILLGEKELPIGLSAGFAIYDRDTANLFELVEFADYAMYRAKNSGKNCFRVFNREEYLQEKVTGENR